LYASHTDGHQEDQLFKIGDFSRIAHVSVKTLRHYAQEGLLEPVWIDRYSGYRYYTLDQLTHLNQILALKDLGFTLDQIKHLLKSGVTADELKGMLRLKRMELRKHVIEEQQRLARIEKRLEQIETEGISSGNVVLLKPIQSSLTAWAHSRAATIEQADDAREGLRQLIFNWCTDQHIRITGQWFSLLKDGSFDDEKVDLHLGVQVELNPTVKEKPAAGPVRLSRLTEIPLAACLLGGTVGQVPQTELLKWIELNGYGACGETRLIYLGETPETPLNKRVIEIQVPVRCGTERDERNIENKEQKMEPVKFETLPAFKVMGMKYRGKNENGEISEMWGKLNPRFPEIPVVGQSAFGVCMMESNAPDGVFEYIAGFKVAADAIPPEGMVVVDVPENKYAVFEHVGGKETLMNTYHLIATEWFPRSGMKPIGGFDMEVYDENFKNFEPDSVMYIYEPIK
jgi:predicted transcriptional regulator YdeE/DNA-binding transcriptional MerR regulator